MASILNVGGKEFTVATVAGKQFGYSKDYLLLLIKSGKIEGQKIGNKWYVFLPSAEIFFKEAEKKRKVQRMEISTLRKTELKKHSRTRISANHKTALIETLAIAIIGLSLGATGYMGTASQTASVTESTSGFFEKVAISLYSFVYPEDTSITINTQTNGIAENSMAATANSNQELGVSTSTISETSMVIAPAESFTAENAKAVQESFSDPVEVTIDPENPETGIIIPKFKNGNGEAYRFLMVPVQTTGTSTN